MKLIHTYIPVILVLLFSCTGKQPQNNLDKDAYDRYLENGSSIASQTQSVLLANVSGAIQKGGSRHAVEFCNLRASGITDSLSNNCNCIISRVTNQKRNPGNGLSNDAEKQLWDYYLGTSKSRTMHDTLLTTGQKVIYYKPITTAMPACLQCHGPVEDMDPETYSIIRELYPDDEAIGYAMNELRGLWKIEFDHTEKSEMNTENIGE